MIRMVQVYLIHKLILKIIIKKIQSRSTHLLPIFYPFFFVARVVKKKEDRKQGANV